MDEAYLKARLKAALLTRMPGGTILRVEDKFTSGIPDIAAAWRGLTTWVEVKYHRRGRAHTVTEGQLLTLRKLFGLLVTYYEADHSVMVEEFHPLAGSKATVIPPKRGGSYDHDGVAMLVSARHQLKSDHEMVQDFHARFGLTAPATPVFDHASIASRIAHIREETEELAFAAARKDLVEVADALADLAYLVHGLAINLGLPWEAIFREVHRTNMQKVVRQNEPGHKFGIAKPPGWRPPDVRGILRKWGWEDKP